MKHSLFLTFLLFILTLGIAHSSFGQKSKKTTAPSTSPGIELVQFHTEHRCMTCNKIEELSRETLKSYAHIPFKLFNVDDSKNEKIAQEFEATGTSLYLYNSKTKKIKDLTDFAFMNAMDRTKFIQGLKKEIAAFK
jgi:hypothetical protein